MVGACRSWADCDNDYDEGEAAVERTQHNQDSQGQILALAFRSESFNTHNVFPTRWEGDLPVLREDEGAQHCHKRGRDLVWEQLTGVEGLLPESQGQDLALTVL